MGWCCLVNPAVIEDSVGSSREAGKGQRSIGEELLRNKAGHEPDEERRNSSSEAGTSEPSPLSFRPKRGQVVPLPSIITNGSAQQKGGASSFAGRSTRDKGAKIPLGQQGGGTPTAGLFGNLLPFGQHSNSGGMGYTADDLQSLGFPVYSIHSLPPASLQLPVAVLALELIEDAVRSARPTLPGALEDSAMPALPNSLISQGSRGRQHTRNKLVPLHVNAACRAFFGLANQKEYAPVIRKLLKRDPLLTFALQKALRYLRAGESQPVSHVTPDPSGQTSTLFGMRITPCLWEDSPQGSHTQQQDGNRSSQGLTPQPALLVEHNLPYNAAEVMPRLM